MDKNYKNLKGVGKPTKYAIKLKIKGMYLRGRQFTHSALLLNEKTGKGYPYLHLLCLGFEIILKSTLLEKDYEKYRDYIKTNLRHDLDKCLIEYINEYEIVPFDKNLILEVSDLNKFYNTFQLKYAMLSEVFIDPKSIDSELTLKFLVKLIEKLDKVFELTS